MTRKKSKRSLERETFRDPERMDLQELKRKARRLGISVDELLKRSNRSLADFLKGRW